MTLLQIRYFIETAKRGSITDAAKAMFVVQPAVTKQLNELEKELGFRLFTRHPRGVELTAAGEIMLNAFETCQAEYKSALTRAREQSSMVDRVSVGLLSSVDLYNVSNVINDFMAEHLGILVNILRLPMEEIFTALETEKIDVAVVIDTSIPPNRGIRHENLFTSRDYILTAKDSVLAAKETVTKEDLRDVPVVMQRFPTNLYRSVFGPQEQICTQLGFSRNNVVFCDNYESCLSAVEYNGCALVIDGLTVFPNKENFRLIDTGFEHHVALAWQGEEPPEAAEPFIEWILDAFRTEA